MPVNILAPYLLTALVYRAQRRIYLSAAAASSRPRMPAMRDSEPSDVPDLMGTLVQTGSKKKAKGPRTRSSKRSRGRRRRDVAPAAMTATARQPSTASACRARLGPTGSRWLKRND